MTRTDPARNSVVWLSPAPERGHPFLGTLVKIGMVRTIGEAVKADETKATTFMITPYSMGATATFSQKAAFAFFTAQPLYNSAFTKKAVCANGVHAVRQVRTPFIPDTKNHRIRALAS